MKKNIFLILSLFLFSALSHAEVGQEFPQSTKQQKSNSYGSLFGNNGFQLFGGSKSNDSSSQKTSASTNQFLWQASLDVISFMPLASTDHSGGVINTDWYEDKDLKDVMYKVNIVIKSSQLDANAFTVRVFKRKFQDGRWHDTKTSDELAIELEDKILAKARELKVIQQETK